MTTSQRTKTNPQACTLAYSSIYLYGLVTVGGVAFMDATPHRAASRRERATRGRLGTRRGRVERPPFKKRVQDHNVCGKRSNGGGKGQAQIQPTWATRAREKVSGRAQ